jgi:hypothetical protein
VAYLIEYAIDGSESFYTEFVIVNKDTGKIIQTTDVNHELIAYRWCDDYGRYATSGAIVASNTNGMITIPAPGVVAVNVPIASFGLSLCGDDYSRQDTRNQTLKCKLVAVPAANAAFTKTLAVIMLSFGARVMTQPRVTFGTVPIYPNKADA